MTQDPVPPGLPADPAPHPPDRSGPAIDPLVHGDPMLDALERQIESTVVPGALPPDDPVGMDPLARMMGTLEASTEGVTVPPAEPEEPALFQPAPPDPPSPALGGPRSPDPPPFPEPTSRVRTAIEPPLAARPYFAHDGLSREPYRPHPGSNTGSLGRTSVPTRWCPDRGEAIEVTACEKCDKWGNHGGQMEECLYDWEERQRAKENQEDEYEE